MYSEDFLHAVHEVLELEGVLSDDPNDRGGLTKYGITHKTWAAWRKKQKRTYPESVADINKSMAIAVYYDEFWKLLKLDLLNSRLIATELFEAAVNVSPKYGSKMFQEAINYCRKPGWPKLVIDGNIGPITRKWANELIKGGYETALFKAMNGEQYIWYKYLDDPNHSRGWTRRLPGPEANTK